MPLTIPHTFTADTDALASEVNDCFAAVAAMFTEGAGGISDSDISTSAAINGSKLSNVVGRQIPTDRIADAAITDAKLSSSASVDANRAVGTDHLKALAVTKAKVAANTLTLAQLALTTQVIEFSSHLGSVAVAAASRLVAITRATNGSGNYTFVLLYYTTSGWLPHTYVPGSAPTAPDTVVSVGTAIPAATYEVIGFYVADEAVSGGTAYRVGKLVIQYLART